MKRWTLHLAAVLGMGLFAACGGGDSEPAVISDLPPLGDLWTLVQTSVEPDSDGDYLPDDVERLVGTNPGNRDTDRDGLTDNYEIFGDGYFDPEDFVPDKDADGNEAPIDADDDGDGRNDGEVIDTDGDEVPNYLEYYGYTYEWMTGRFLAWNGDPDVPHWFTDPLQRSTDQDAFADGMEVSGAIMDVSVADPGSDPLVPAYPNIVVELQGYAVTLNETITYTDGGALAKGTTWSRETSESSSSSTERSWEVGASLTLGWGTTKAGGEVSFSAKYGEKYSSTQTTSTTVSVGGSVLDETNWSRARSLNPTDAARLKLFLKVHNFGTACASNILPTLTLRIGGLNVATFEPGTSGINMLVPGGAYPPDPGVTWVVDSVRTAGGSGPLSVTMDELRALERGAPVSIAVNQLAADVVLAEGGGGYTSVGDANEYMARCSAVGANIRVDLGDGSFVHYLVFADDSPSAPRVTLEDALRRIGLGEDGKLLYHEPDGAPRLASLENYTFLFDQETLLQNGWNLETSPAEPPRPDFEMADMRLLPGTSIFLKAPRNPQDVGPVIYYAYVDPHTLEIKVCAGDYQGIESVEYVDKENEFHEMTEEMTDSGFYFLIPEASYVFDGSEKVVVTNLKGETRERLLDVVFYPQPKNPVINFHVLDIAGRKLYANVSNPAPAFPITWVRALHAGFDNGFLDMQKPVNAYEDPDGWVAELPSNWSSVNIKIVAYVTEGVYSEVLVSPSSVITPLRVGTADLYAEFDWTATDEWWDTAVDLDSESPNTWQVHQDHSAYLFPATWELYHWWHNNVQWELTMNVPYSVMQGDFDSITRDQIIGSVPSSMPGLPDAMGYSLSDIFLVRTSGGNYAKVALVSQKDDSSSVGEWRNRHLQIKYVVYSPPQASAGPDQAHAVVHPTGKTITLNGAGSAGATTYSWALLSKPAGSLAALSGAATATPTFQPDLPGAYTAKLTVNGDSSLTDQVTITVFFPLADAGTDRVLDFYPSDDPIALNGSASEGADTWEWVWVERPAGSAAALTNRFTSAPKFVPDLTGRYIAKLTINSSDATYRSEDTVTIDVTVH